MKNAVSHRLNRRQFALSAGALALAPAVEAKTAKNAETAVEKFDAVVIGAGVTGLTAALAAAQAGGRVALLEKMASPAGNSLYAAGAICAINTRFQKAEGLTDSVDALLRDMAKVSSGRGDPALSRIYAESIGESVNWVADTLGLDFDVRKNRPWPILSRHHWVKKPAGYTGGSWIVKNLLEAAVKNGVKVFYHTKAVSLIDDGKGGVAGVHTLTPDGYRDFYAKGGVLLATGGFSANGDLVSTFIGAWAERLVLRGSKLISGENIMMTRPFGAQMVNLDQFHAGAISKETHANQSDILNANHGIIVNLRGERFLDEAETYVMKAKLCARNTPENKAVAIFDSQNPRIGINIPRYDALSTTYYKADTLEELCRKADLPYETVRREVDRYNQAVNNGRLKEMTPPCNVGRGQILGAKPPFYAIPFEGGLTATFGGPLINTKTEVQNLEGRSIPGLFAAGNAAGGLFFNNYIGGSQFGAGLVFGRTAAREILARAKRAA